MNEPTITCGKCNNVIKLTESLAAPLIESKRREFEQRLAQKDADIAKREEEVSKAKETLNAEVANKVRQERAKIEVEEAKKAKLLFETDLEQKQKENDNLQEVLKQRDAKLAEAQKAQTELVQKQRELDDAKREMDLTLEKKVQEAHNLEYQKARREFEEKRNMDAAETSKTLAAMQSQIDHSKKKDAEIAKREEALSKARETLDAEVANKVRQERGKIEAAEAKKAKLIFGTDLEQKQKENDNLQEVLKQKDAKLAEAQKAQANLIQKQRELDDAKREMDLTVQKGIQMGLATTREKAIKEVEDAMHLKVKEKEQTIESMQKTIEELKRKADQGSQQLQGEVLELELEEVLRISFPYDRIEPVRKGARGADVLQRVLTPTGHACGTIIWEAKRAEAWSEKWVQKLKDNQMEAGAELAVIVTTSMPKDSKEPFLMLGDIWVVSAVAVRPLAETLRSLLFENSKLRLANTGKNEKMECLYDYLSSPQFAQRIRSVVETFIAMKKTLEQEKNAMARLWKQRDAQIERVASNMSGMCGELQAISHGSLHQIDAIEQLSLPSGDDK